MSDVLLLALVAILGLGVLTIIAAVIYDEIVCRRIIRESKAKRGEWLRVMEAWKPEDGPPADPPLRSFPF